MIQHHEFLEHCFCDAEIAQLVESRTFTSQAICAKSPDQVLFPDANAQCIYQYTY